MVTRSLERRVVKRSLRMAGWPEDAVNQPITISLLIARELVLNID